MVLKLRAGDFFGAPAKSLSILGFRFSESSYSPQISLPRHSHELAHFCFVLQGSYTENLGNKSAERTPATLIFYPPDTIHAEGSHTGGRHFLIEVETWRIETLRDYGALVDEPLAFRGESDVWPAARLYREFCDMDELSPLALEGLALELVVNAVRRRGKNQAPKWLDLANQALRANFSNPPSLGSLAEIAGVHPVHLARVFHKFMHCTIGEYVRHLRVEHACSRMTTSDEPLVDIALSTGFVDHAHFSRSFKRVTGMTPTQYRETRR